MKIIKAKTAGFCFGVDRAVKMAYDLLQQGEKVASLGPLIHNPQCVADLTKKGARSVNSISELENGEKIIIRSHGVPKSVYDEIAEKKIVSYDATCPFVSKIHKIAKMASDEDKLLLVAGDKMHPEVQGIVGHTTGKVFVFSNLQELMEYFGNDFSQNMVIMVAQTTFEVTKWLECSEFIKNLYTNAQIFDTICSATWARQQEAEELARKCDLMVVIGGRHSSNTQKLVAVAGKLTKVITVETAQELKKRDFENVACAGVTAGASTPSSIIEEVLSVMSESVKEEELSFAELFEEFTTPNVHRGKEVTGIVTSISPNEVQVDIGTKHTGFIKLEELADDTTAPIDTLVKKGDELNLVVMQVNDQDGIVYLSQRQFEARKGDAEIRAALESGDVLDGYVKEFNKGGLVVVVKGVNVFVPASQATMRRGDDYTKLVHTHVQLKVKPGEGSRLIGSIRDVISAQQSKVSDAFWSSVEVGKHYSGTVKSLTGYGAFVDIGGVDGLVHISELSWDRIKTPSEVVKVGDVIDVYVKEIDSEKHKVSLGYKKAEDDPWMKLRDGYPVGSVFNAPVVSVTKFGAFVRILPGIDGLVHISEISNDHVDKVSDALKVGDEVDVKLTEIDFDKKRISLSIKALTAPVEDTEVQEEVQTEVQEQAQTEAPVEVQAEVQE